MAFDFLKEKALWLATKDLLPPVDNYRRPAIFCVAPSTKARLDAIYPILDELSDVYCGRELVQLTCY